MAKRKSTPLTLKSDQEKKKKQKIDDAKKNREKSDRKNENRRKRCSDSEYLQAELARDSLSRQNRRSNPEYLQAESSNDLMNLQQRRENPEYLHAESARDSLSHQNRRSIPEYLEAESARDLLSLQQRRGDARNHVELTGYRIDNQLTIINLYNNPATNLELLKEAFSEIENYIGTADVLVMGDFNHQLQVGNELEKFMQLNFNMKLLSPREPTTNAGTCIDGVFGRLTNFELDIFIYKS